MSNEQKNSGCLTFVLGFALCFVLFLFYSERQEKKKAEVLNNYVLEQKQKEQQRNYTIQQTDTQTIPYRKPKPLTPKERKGIEEESQNEWDVREEAEEQMDERGIDEPY